MDAVSETSASAAGTAPRAQPQALARMLEKIQRVVYERGDVELILRLDALMDYPGDDERKVALAAIVRELQRPPAGNGQSSGNPA